MKEFIKTSFIMMVFLMLMAVNTYAEVPNMEVKSWCADDMAVGNTTGYNGLEFMLPVGGTADNGIQSQIKVECIMQIMIMKMQLKQTAPLIWERTMFQRDGQ